jgi:hypothetical protein
MVRTIPNSKGIKNVARDGHHTTMGHLDPPKLGKKTPQTPKKIGEAFHFNQALRACERQGIAIAMAQKNA